MPNPLTDELTADAKAELSATFAAMRARFAAFDAPVVRVRRKHRRDPWGMR